VLRPGRSTIVTTDEHRGPPNDDGSPHHIVVDGRRWRATDPSIPENLRGELVAELMSARRAVGAATRAGDDQATTTARARVQDAKVALGERGHPWWEPATPEALDRRIRSTIAALLAHRGPQRSICPSDAARVVGGASWRPTVGPVREVARDLARRGEVRLTSGRRELDPDGEIRGPIRIRPITGAAVSDGGGSG
jgi:hypothetical protein